MEEILIKTHLIITDIQDEYSIKWCGKIIETKPLLKEGIPCFVIIGTSGRVELNTINIKQLEETAKD